MGSTCTKRYSEEFKRDAIALVASSGRTVTEVAREPGISSESPRNRVKKVPVRADTRMTSSSSVTPSKTRADSPENTTPTSSLTSRTPCRRRPSPFIITAGQSR
ncbi:transposase [Streptomyces sp. NPDC002476]|uniref:transposase n=1 Tax=Streptomyces sp. NPDC002476 TaxID=3364648 RepID=UPI0036814897